MVKNKRNKGDIYTAYKQILGVGRGEEKQPEESNSKRPVTEANHPPACESEEEPCGLSCGGVSVHRRRPNNPTSSEPIDDQTNADCSTSSCSKDERGGGDEPPRPSSSTGYAHRATTTTVQVLPVETVTTQTAGNEFPKHLESPEGACNPKSGPSPYPPTADGKTIGIPVTPGKGSKRHASKSKDESTGHDRKKRCLQTRCRKSRSSSSPAAALKRKTNHKPSSRKKSFHDLQESTRKRKFSGKTSGESSECASYQRLTSRKLFKPKFSGNRTPVNSSLRSCRKIERKQDQRKSILTRRSSPPFKLNQSKPSKPSEQLRSSSKHIFRRNSSVIKKQLKSSLESSKRQDAISKRSPHVKFKSLTPSSNHCKRRKLTRAAVRSVSISRPEKTKPFYTGRRKRNGSVMVIPKTILNSRAKRKPWSSPTTISNLRPSFPYKSKLSSVYCSARVRSRCSPLNNSRSRAPKYPARVRKSKRSSSRKIVASKLTRQHKLQENGRFGTKRNPMTSIDPGKPKLKSSSSAKHAPRPTSSKRKSRVKSVRGRKSLPTTRKPCTAATTKSHKVKKVARRKLRRRRSVLSKRRRKRGRSAKGSKAPSSPSTCGTSGRPTNSNNRTIWADNKGDKRKQKSNYPARVK